MRPLILALLVSGSAASAQTLELNFNAGVGVQTQPEYFGSADSVTGATGSFSFGDLTIRGRCFGCGDSSGVGFTGSFRFIGEREASDDTIVPLTEVDAAVELGGGLSYASDAVEGYAVVRRGFGGHEGFVFDIGGDLVMRPAEALTLRVGPRLLAGDETYMETYFAGGAFVPEAGLVSRGVQAQARYDVNDTWGLVATARYDQLLEDAADSPVSVDDDQATFSLIVTRNFSLSF